MPSAPRPAPASRPVLDRDKIVTEALRIADAEGLPALTARALASRLGVTPMALYRHVDGMPGLHRAMVERAIADARILDHHHPALQPYLVETFARIHGCLAAHPAIVPLVASSAAFGRATLGVADTVLSRLLASGFDATSATRTFHAMLGFSLGAATLASGERARADEPPDLEGAPAVRATLRELSRMGRPRAVREELAAIVRNHVALARSAG